jgi:tetratricopeptide (TPR) repeat protein
MRVWILILCVLLVSLESKAGAGIEDGIGEARQASLEGDYAAAIAILEKGVLVFDSVATAEERLEALELLGVAHAMSGNLDEAALSYELRWLSLVTKYGAEALPAVRESGRVANALVRAGQYEKGRSYWRLHLAAAHRGGLEEMINEADAMTGIAQSYAGVDQEASWPEAEKWFQRALEHVPKDRMQRAMILFEYGELVDRMGRPKDASKLKEMAYDIQRQSGADR